MKCILSILICICIFLPNATYAQTADFLNAKIKSVERSLVCTDSEKANCKSVFLIQGKNFINSNGTAGVKVADEWAQILRASDTSIVAIASADVYNDTPTVSIDTTLQKPTLIIDDENLSGMFNDSVNVALSSIRIAGDGSRYFIAGEGYTDTARVYYRDSFWTSGLILMIEPYVVRDQILLLASGVKSNGSVPSAIPVEKNGRRLQQWEDHFDSGSYFILLVYDYIRWTGDSSILEQKVNGRTIFTIMEDVVSYLSTKDTDDNLLPEKPVGSMQDWLDTIPRAGEVFSNEVIYYRAIQNLSELAKLVGEPSHATAFDRQSLLIRYQLNKNFWNESKGYYLESCLHGSCEDRLTNDSALAILFDIADKDQREKLYESLKTLETRNNTKIRYGDWGVINAWPLYNERKNYHYQNGTDWPFLDGINAGARLKFGNADWYYPLTRWWTFNKERGDGKILPEYISPIDNNAGDKQAWSVNPAVSFVRYGIGIDPDLSGAYTTKRSPCGEVMLKNVYVRGHRISVTAKAKR